nr:MBL fold metallo-hydrolase [Paraflavitalea speifideiaquila]
MAVDAGPDFRYQMLRTNVKHLDAIVFTHPHKDHVAGLDDVRAFNFFSQQPMKVFANEMTQEVIIREFPYAFMKPGIPVCRRSSLQLLTSPLSWWEISWLPQYRYGT